jgi:hypothetical protein
VGRQATGIIDKEITECGKCGRCYREEENSGKKDEKVTGETVTLRKLVPLRREHFNTWKR